MKKTYRLHFESMPWLHKFHVIPHICKTLDCNPDKAESVFHQLRNKGIIVYSRKKNAWRGDAYVWTPNPTDSIGQLWSELRGAKKRIRVLRRNDLILRDELSDALKRIALLEEKI